MSADSHVTATDEPFARPALLVAMAGMIAATVVGNAMFSVHAPAVPVLALGAAYLLLITAGWAWGERRGRRVLGPLLVALFALTLAILWVSQQALSLLVFPLLLLVVLHAGLRWAIAVTVGLTAAAAVQSASAGLSALDVYLLSSNFVPGAVLTMAFGAVIVRERDTQRQLRRFAAQAEELAATRERNRIARDIHDSVGHYLTVVNVQIEAARSIIAARPAAADECLVRAQELARDGLAELRRSVSMLRAGPLEQRPFGVALVELVDDSRRAGLDATLAIEGAARALAPALEFALYRAAQEALTNVQRHARATVARCTLAYGERAVRLRIEDDGVGAAATDAGFGLVGMRERVAAVGGTVELRTSPGHGFAIEVHVPT